MCFVAEDMQMDGRTHPDVGTVKNWLAIILIINILNVRVYFVIALRDHGSLNDTASMYVNN